VTEDETTAHIRAALAGGQDSYTALHKEVTKIVKPVSYKFFHGSAEGEDFECEAATHVLMRLDKFNGDSRFSTWVTRVALNEAHERFRGKAKHHRALLSYDAAEEESGKSLIATFADPSDAYAQIEVKQLLAVVLGSLSAESQYLLTAKYMQGYRSQYMADELGITLAALKARVHRALLEARTIMEGLNNGTSAPLHASAPAELVPVNPRSGNRLITCACGCNLTCEATGPRQKYIPGHAPTPAPVKTARGDKMKAFPHLAPRAQETVQLSVPVKALDHLLSMLPAKTKAKAVESALAEMYAQAGE
jgi:RNA polymerase sigma-70 factor (ECF subfamily)